MAPSRVYDEFLKGVQMSNWLDLHSARSVIIGNDASRKPVIASSADRLEEKQYVANSQDEAPWSPAHTAGVVVGIVLSAVTALIGILLIVGIITFTAAFVVPVHPQSPPTPPSPPPSPMYPPMLPGAVTTGTGAATCTVLIAGISVSRTYNGLCEDSGAGSTSGVCPLGTDFPDCPLRFTIQSPSNPSPPLRPQPSPPPPYPPPPLSSLPNQPMSPCLPHPITPPRTPPQPASPPHLPLQGTAVCSDSCRVISPSGTFDYSNNGVCEDGAENSVYSYCSVGSDCSDCGTRHVR